MDWKINNRIQKKISIKMVEILCDKKQIKKLIETNNANDEMHIREAINDLTKTIIPPLKDISIVMASFKESLENVKITPNYKKMICESFVSCIIGHCMDMYNFSDKQLMFCVKETIKQRNNIIKDEIKK